MEQMDLIDWLDDRRVIKQQLPIQSIQHRLFIIKQLKPIMRELEALEISALTISEAIAHYQELYREKAQQAILSPFK